jgi:hypothetical protein
VIVEDRGPQGAHSLRLCARARKCTVRDVESTGLQAIRQRRRPESNRCTRLCGHPEAVPVTSIWLHSACWLRREALGFAQFGTRFVTRRELMAGASAESSDRRCWRFLPARGARQF